jgi:hypothetical protein
MNHPGSAGVARQTPGIPPDRQTPTGDTVGRRRHLARRWHVRTHGARAARLPVKDLAETGISYCKGANKLTECGEDLTGLVPADGGLESGR